uniref:Uncharacterized protein n=1 Tax=Anguilla anguilla TaxID=7936 RepID=A0A0E9QHC8_ANGAN
MSKYFRISILQKNYQMSQQLLLAVTETYT